ncbi:uncharacterized protein PHACADRAFT_100098 [Phanerochaete carnosa HHB-10118-sp]|uniref:Uncharacterized protein n=1 Tax=Phanerochaete carnosa (strain HHB-10118-sp) TaxID=650164 RepID=K5W0D2_PHACS|nr:uncharacterized protein PHACADRAFT_100098 [Phanerochaete carnosa HHB-10118-sp]EKM52560.1 hypothetical protein PHACADRAFT_100098 [Phanerochaete carnosa HHB-10118-sp]
MSSTPTAPSVPAEDNARPSNRPNWHPVHIRFANVSAAEASDKKVTLSAKREASYVYTSKLILTETQWSAVEALYNESKTMAITYQRTKDDQIAAAAVLAMEALDEDSQEALGSRWSVQYTRTTGKEAGVTTRILYQWCAIDINLEGIGTHY